MRGLWTASWKRYVERSGPGWLYRALTGAGLALVLAAYVLARLAVHAMIHLPLSPRVFVGVVGWAAARCLFCGVDNLLGLGEAERRALAASAHDSGSGARLTGAARAGTIHARR